jgi:hypothetical protein
MKPEVLRPESENGGSMREFAKRGQRAAALLTLYKKTI